MHTSSLIDRRRGLETSDRRPAGVRPIHPKIGVPIHWEDAVATVSLVFLTAIVLVLIYQAMVF